MVHYVPFSFLERSQTGTRSTGVPFSVAVEPRTSQWINSSCRSPLSQCRHRVR